MTTPQEQDNIEDVEFSEEYREPDGWNDTSAPWPFTDADIVQIEDDDVGTIGESNE
jgi:hypothetical protein